MNFITFTVVVAAFVPVATVPADPPSAEAIYGQPEAPRYDSDLGPGASVIADFDGDGRLDLATANRDHPSVSVRFTDEAGLPGPQVLVDAGGGPTALASGDFNGDGLADLVTLHREDSSWSIILANAAGGGGFEPAFTRSATAFPEGPVVADFDGDGHLDLAYGAGAPPYVRVHLGDGSGALGPPIETAMPVRPTALVARDFDGDGRLDLASFSNLIFQVAIATGVGDGTFEDVQTLAVSGMPQAIGALDGRPGAQPGLAVSVFDEEASSDALIRWDRVDGVWGPTSSASTVRFGWQLVTVDVDGDGDLDAILTDGLENVAVHRQLEDGRIGAAESWGIERASFFGGSAITAGDLDGDGAPDLVLPERSANVFTVASGDGDGGFLTERRVLMGAAPAAITTADFDGDGITDIAAIDRFTGAINARAGIGGARFGPRIDLGDDWIPREIVHGDFNGDGRVDLAAISGGALVVIPSSDDGAFGQPVSRSLPNAAAVAAGDVTGDGIDDVVVARGSTGGVVLLPGDPEALIGRASEIIGGALTTRLVVADLDADGDQDLALASEPLDSVSTVENLGGGVFIPRPGTRVAGGPTDLVVADLGEDGVLDAVVSLRGGGAAVLTGRPGVTFGPPNRLDAGLETVAIAVADVTGDAQPDIVAADREPPGITIHAGVGGGDFTLAGSVLIISAPEDLQVADIDGRFGPDLVIGGFTITLLLANDPATFGGCAEDVDGSGTVDLADLLIVLASWGPCDGCVADVDGDEAVGFTDLVAVLAAWGAC